MKNEMVANYFFIICNPTVEKRDRIMNTLLRIKHPQ